MTDGHDSHDGTVAQRAAGPEGRILRYPPSPWALQLFCLALMAGVLTAYYLVLGLLAGALLFGLLCLDEVARLRRRFCGPLGILDRFARRKGFAFTPNGVTINGIFVPSRGLLWIDAPWVLRGGGLLRLHTEAPRTSLRRRKRRKGTSDDAPADVTFRVVGSPFFYRDVLPQMLRHQPDLTLAAHVRDGLEDPERPDRARFWPALVGLCVLVAGLAAVLLSGWEVPPEEWAPPMAAAAWAASLLVLWATAWRRGPAGNLCAGAALVAAMFGLAVMFPVLTWSALSLRMATLTALTVSVAALAVWVGRGRLRRGAQVLLAAAVLAVPVGYRVHILAGRWPGARVLPREQVTWGITCGSVLWSTTGRHLVSSSGPRLRLADLEVQVGLPDVPLDWLVYADDSRVVSEGVRCAIHVQDLASGDSYPLFPAGLAGGQGSATTKKRVVPPWSAEFDAMFRYTQGPVRRFRYSSKKEPPWLEVGTIAPVCPRRERLAYLEVRGTGERTTLHIWDLSKREPLGPTVELPPDCPHGVAQPVWTGDQEITVVDTGGCEDGFGGCLDVLRLSTADGILERHSSRTRADHWVLAPGCRHALSWTEHPADVPSISSAVLPGWHRRGSVVLVGLDTGKETALPGMGSIPVLAVEAGCAFRSVEHAGELMLTRIDYRRATAEALWRVPDGWHLLCVSRPGGVALFERPESVRGFPSWALMRIADGRWHMLDYRVWDDAMYYVPAPSGYDGPTAFSPDGHFILMPVYGLLNWLNPEFVLVPIPDDWRGGAGEGD